LKNNLINAVWSVFFSFLFTNTVVAAETLLSCPAEIPGSLLQVQPPSPEWQEYVEPRHLLLSAGFMSNEPSKLRHLVQDSSKETKGRYIATWSFNEREFPDGKWLNCDYGAFSLSKKIDENFSKCSIIYVQDKKTKRIEGVEKIICK